MTRARTVIVLLVLLLVITGCGDDGVATSAPSTTSTAPATSTTTSTAVPPTTPATTTTSTAITDEGIAYFSEVALGAEFGDTGNEVRKWTQDVRIVVHGSPTEADLEALDDVLSDLDDLIDSIELSVVESVGNIDLHFAPESEFSSIEPDYIPVNMGFFWVYWSESSLTDATILISTTGVTQAERSHLIREELTQSLGMMNDSFLYENSIFYQGWTDVEEYSPIDEQVIWMLYRPEVRHGMSADEVMAVLAGS